MNANCDNKKPIFKSLGFQLEPSGNGVYRIETIKKYCDILSVLGYDTLYLDISGAFEIKDEPYFCYMRGRYTCEELREIDSYATEKGLRVIPIIQTLAHLQFLFQWKEYQPIRDMDDILLVGEERTYTLIENMIKTMASCFSSNIIHLGMDEAHNLGKGRYRDKNGDIDKITILKEHFGRVFEIAKRYGYKCQIWGDMLCTLAYGGFDGDFLFDKFDKSQDVSKIIPQDVDVVYWDYYGRKKAHYTRFIQQFKKLSKNLIFAGGACNWLGFCPHNSFSIEVTRKAFEACREEGIENVFITTWQDNGADASIFSILPTVVAAAEFARGNFDLTKIKERFKEVVGADFDDFLALEEVDKIKTLDTNPERYLLTPTKYLLYNDPFIGYWDSTINECDREVFRSSADRLGKAANNKQWGYLFQSIEALARVMEIKYDLGVKTRKAYQAGDKKELLELTQKAYPELIKRLKKFYRFYEKRWTIENKTTGFDVQDIRLGGLIQRVEHCRNLLQQYLAGKIEKIDDLELEVLDFKNGKWATTYNYYRESVTVNKL